MKKSYDVPFVGNAPDDAHCYQATISMIVQYFHPEMKPTLADMDVATGKQPNKTVWPFQGLIYLKSLGIDITLVTPFRYDEFVKEGVEYIRRMYGDEVANWQDENSDIPMEVTRIETLQKEVTIDYRNPTYDDILKGLKKYPVMCSVNSDVLRGEDGYSGHFVVISGCDNEGLYLNDPGLPPLKNRYVTREVFEEAWAGFSSDEAKFLYLVSQATAPKSGFLSRFQRS